MADRKKFSDAYVSTLSCPSNRSNQTFTDVGGNLSLTVSKTGRKTWKFRYRHNGGNPVDLKLGEWPHMTVNEARERAAFLAAIRSEGRDPRHATYDRRKTPTVSDVLDHHLSTLRGESKRNATSVYRDLRADHGNTLVSDFSRSLLRDWINENYERRPGAAVSLLRNLSSAFRKAGDSLSGLSMPPGLENPAFGLKRHIPILADYRPGSYATNFDPEDIQRMFAGFERAYANKEIGPAGVMVLELLMLTGARPMEIASLRWDQIVTVDGHKVIVKDKHKTWLKTGRPRRIWVMPEAEKVLDRAREAQANNPSEWVFPQRRSQKNQRHPHVRQLTSYSERVGKLAGVSYVPYNLRSAYINFVLDRIGMAALELVAENVGHKNSATTMKYYRKMRDQKLLEAARLADAAYSDIRDSRSLSPLSYSNSPD